MMDFLSKVFDKIASIKGGIILIVSFVFGILGVIIFPNAFKAFHQKLPFENTYNIAIGFAFFVCCLYLLFYFVSFGLPRLIHKIRNALVVHIQKKIDYDAEIDSLMCFFDAVSDFDHDIVVSLLNNRNKIPYTCNRYSHSFDSHSPFYFLCEIQMFNVHPVRAENGKSFTILHSYTLTSDMYDKLLYIYKKYKRLSHIERPFSSSNSNKSEE